MCVAIHGFYNIFIHSILTYMRFSVIILLLYKKVVAGIV